MSKVVYAKIEQYFKPVKNIAAVYVFGSYAKGTKREHSDIDIAVLFLKGKEISWEQSLVMKDEISDLLTIDVDLIIMNISNPILKHQIYKHSHRVITRDTYFINEFFVRSLMEYTDIKMTRAIIETKILNRRIYG
jgi:uncharacterized protein